MQALYAQLLVGLINGSFYALLSLGLAVIFGMLNIINFTHGAQYMMGAFVAFLLLQLVGLNYWFALLVAPRQHRSDMWSEIYSSVAASQGRSCDAQRLPGPPHPGWFQPK